MLDGLFMLLALSSVMAIASFLAGALPLTLSLSQSHSRLISTLGMGVLVGTSLIVIIPEGIETLYSAAGSGISDLHDRSIGNANPLLRPHNLGARNPMYSIVDDIGVIVGRDTVAQMNSGDHIEPASSGNPSTASNHPVPTTPDALPLEGDDEDPKLPPPLAPRRPHAYVGLALILGFILMYLIDQVPQHASASSSATQRPYHISLDNLSQGLYRVASADSSNEPNGFLGSSTSSSVESTVRQARSLSTTTGLVIHAAADGIALGASSTTSSSSLGIVIFFAIMIHKAPAAFGLTSVLLKQGLTKREARSHLVIFSLAAPAGAMATWLVVHLLGGRVMGGEEGTRWWTGLLLLFSAGTFLYVAMHTMQESNPAAHSGYSNGHSEGGGSGSGGRRKEGPAMRDTLAAVVGMLIPLLTQVGHAH